MNTPSPKHKQTGITLVELMLSVAVLGILMAVIGPMVSSALMMVEAAGRKQVAVDNQKLSHALLRYASQTEEGGLPDKPGNWGVISDSSAVLLKAEVQASGVAPEAVNTTGTGLRHVKVYRRVTNQQAELPLYFTTGPTVTLHYDVGVIYQTTCPELSACANSSLPGSSGAVVVTGASGATPEFNAANLSSWEVAGEDYAAVMFNTLDVQKDRLRITLGRINRLTDRLSSYYYARARADTRAVNHFPTQAGGVSAGAQNCNASWINLKGSDVLKALALDGEEFGETPWGGQIQYCPDYGYIATPAGGPFYAALRFNKNLTTGVAPAGDAQNVVITF